MNINKETAKKLYPESPGWFREQLESEFGADYLDPNPWENIKILDDACTKLKIDFSEIISKVDTPDVIAYKKLKIIIRAINTNSEGKTWKPDWKDTDQRKWWPWFNLSSGSGFGFSVSDFYCGRTNASVGARLCFQKKEQSDFAANQFIELYEQLLT